MRVSARALAAAVSMVAFMLPAAASAQVTLPWLEDFEGTSNEQYTGTTATLAGLPDWEFVTTKHTGPFDNTIGSGAYVDFPQRIIGDVIGNAVLVESVAVFADTAGDVTVNLYDSADTLLQTTTVTINTPGVKTRIPLNWTIAPGTGYEWGREGSVVDMYRNDGGVSYPYGNNAFVLTGSTAGSTFYYWFYDFEVQEIGDGFLDTQPDGIAAASGGTGSASMSRITLCSFESPPTNDLIATLDMTSYDATTDDVLLEFAIMNHGDEEDPEDVVSVRGSTADAWVDVGDFFALTNSGTDGVHFFPTEIDVSAALVAAGQNFTAGFQLRFTQHDDCELLTTTTNDGYSFDDIRLYQPLCGDGVIEGSETCDDSNAMPNDGCSDACLLEAGWNCVGEPTTCTEICGDGLVVGAETCDDDELVNGDGCDDACAVETGWTCMGEPSTCTETCSDGLIVGTETCDDNNLDIGDGCDDMCVEEAGWTCINEPSICSEDCGDGLIVGVEECDDFNVDTGDGCDAICEVETGWSCLGEPSICAEGCGDGSIVGGEVCDDANLIEGDGCGDTCQVESGWACTGEPSSCAEICGDGLIVGGEACDDANTEPGDGCDAACVIEDGWTCQSTPSICAGICGDGLVRGSEGCDDANNADGDGCDADCAVEDGYSCVNEPSECGPTCGDGILIEGEACDDGNAADGDGCDARCLVEPGFTCDGQPSICTNGNGAGGMAPEDDEELVIDDGGCSCRAVGKAPDSDAAALWLLIAACISAGRRRRSPSRRG